MLKFELVEEVATTMGAGLTRGLFEGNEEWKQRAIAEPNCPLYIYTHPMVVVDEDGLATGEYDDGPVVWVIYYVQGTQAIFCSVQEMMSSDVFLLRRHAAHWVK